MHPLGIACRKRERERERERETETETETETERAHTGLIISTETNHLSVERQPLGGSLRINGHDEARESR